MASESVVITAGAPASGQVESKGLKPNAIGFISNVVISTASPKDATT